MAAFMQLGSNMNIFAPTSHPLNGGNSPWESGGILTPTKAALLLKHRGGQCAQDQEAQNVQDIEEGQEASADNERRGSF